MTRETHVALLLGLGLIKLQFLENLQFSITNLGGQNTAQCQSAHLLGHCLPVAPRMRPEGNATTTPYR